MKAAVYARISQDKAGDAHGVDDQEARCRKLAKERGLRVIETYVDNDVSAFSGKTRPAWTRLLADIDARRLDVVVAYANDRLYRRIRDQLDLMEAVQRIGGKIITVLEGETDPASAEGRMRMGILANVAEFESARKAERMRSRIETNAAQGRHHGRPGFGWFLHDGEWLLNDDEAELVHEAATRVIDGETCHEIVRDWNRRGVTTQTGKPWVHQTLRRILRSPTTAGLRSHNGTVIAEGHWPPLLDRGTWEHVCAALMPTKNYQRRAARGYLLSGLVFCTKDGAKMTGHKGRTPGWATPHGYECQASGCGRRITRDGLDSHITEAVLHVFDTAPLWERLVEAQSEGVSRALSHYGDASSRMEELARMFAGGELSKTEWRAAQPVAAQKLAKAERQLAEHRGGLALQEIQGLGPTDLLTWWMVATPRWRRDIVELVIERIDIAPASAPGKRFEPERVSVTWRS